MIKALWSMMRHSKNQNRYLINSSRKYEHIKNQYSDMMKIIRSGSKHSEETKKKISNALKKSIANQSFL